VSVTINVNGLSLCHKGSGGVSMATIPDVCKTPSPGGPVPIPYPNVARSSDLAKGTTTVSADGGNMCANYGSEFSLSTGDEPGTVGGVKSSTFKKEATWITYSFDVKLEGKGACRLTDKMFHNHQNTVNMGGIFQKFLQLAGGDADKACEMILDRIKELIGEGQTGKSPNGIRGLEERFSQQINGGSLGPMGAPNAPPLPSARNGLNSWQNHNEQIKAQQKNLERHLDEYDDKCGGDDPPPSNAREWSRKPLPQASEWKGPVYAPSVAPSGGVGQTLLKGALIVGAGLAAAATVAAILCPFDGPAGDVAGAAATTSLWGMAMAL
jgi:hypothetical protein